MELIPGAYEMLAYLVHHDDQLSEWEQNFVGNMQYWLKVRKREPDQIQLMMLTMIYNRLKSRIDHVFIKKTEDTRNKLSQQDPAEDVINS